MRKKLMKTALVVISLTIFATTVLLAEPLFQAPVLISSAGQSADVKLVGMLAKRAQIENIVELIATEKNLDGIKTLIVVPGFSSKGLGAAGVSAADEINRVKALLAAANEQNIPVVLVHIGGNARRYGQSDQFIEEVAQYAKAMIVVEQGNEDQLFTKIASEKNIPLTLVPKIVAAGEPLKNFFK